MDTLEASIHQDKTHYMAKHAAVAEKNDFSKRYVKTPQKQVRTQLEGNMECNKIAVTADRSQKIKMTNRCSKYNIFAF